MAVVFCSTDFISLPEEMFYASMASAVREALKDLGDNIIVLKLTGNASYSNYVKLSWDDKKLVDGIYEDSLDYPYLEVTLSCDNGTLTASVFHLLDGAKKIEKWLFKKEK